MAIDIDRGFVRIAGGLVHYRHARPPPVDQAAPRPRGDAPPLLLLHAAPGSSRDLAALLPPLADGRRVLAPDLPGMGDSEPHRLPTPEIADYADDIAALLDALGLDRVDVYGRHTGAQVGIELSLRHPLRVRRQAFDGLALFPESLKAELLARYAPPVSPDAHGGHLAWAWHFVRELSLHFPHYVQDPAHRLHDSPVPAPPDLQLMTLDLLKALPGYHLVYRAAFSHPVGQRLALVRHPTLPMAAVGDPLERYLDAAAALLGQGLGLRVARESRAEALLGFLDA